MQDCQDLFMSAMDDDLEIDACSMFVAKTRAQGASRDAMVIDAPESFLYSSSSESDADVCFSDVDIPKVMLTEGLEVSTNHCIHSVRRALTILNFVEGEVALALGYVARQANGVRNCASLTRKIAGYSPRFFAPL